MPVDDLYTVTAVPAGLPVTLRETKDFIGSPITETYDDVLIESLMDASVDQCEKFTNRVFVTRTFQGLFSAIETTQCEVSPFVQIRRAPLGEISAVELMIDDTFTAVDAADYDEKDSSAYARLLFLNTLATADNVAYPLRITFTAGYGAAALVPDGIKTAIKQLVLFWYENRGDVIPEGKESIPIVVKAILKKYRILNTYG